MVMAMAMAARLFSVPMTRASVAGYAAVEPPLAGRQIRVARANA
jgi:hypothetical protein